MEMINVTGYLAEEKLEIAKNYLVPKQLEEHGLAKDGLEIDKECLEDIIDEYTHESGEERASPGIPGPAHGLP